MKAVYSLVLFILLVFIADGQNVKVDNTKPHYKGNALHNAAIRKSVKAMNKQIDRFYTKRRYGYLFKYKLKKSTKRF